MNQPLQHPHSLANGRMAQLSQAQSHTSTDTSILFPTNHEASQTMLFDISAAPYSGNDDTTSFFSPPHPSSTIGSPLMSLPVFHKNANARHGPLSSTRSPSSSKQPIEEEQEEILQDDRHTMKEIVTRLDKVGLRESLRGTGKENRHTSKADYSTLNLGRYDETAGASVLFKLDKEMKPLMAESFMAMPSSSDTSSSTLFSDTSDVQPPPEPAWKTRLSQQTRRSRNITPGRASASSTTSEKDRTPIASASATTTYKPLLPKSISTPVISRISTTTAGPSRPLTRALDEHTPVRLVGRTDQDRIPGESRAAAAANRPENGRTPLINARTTATSSRSPVKQVQGAQSTPVAVQPNAARSRYGRSPMATTSSAAREAHTPVSKTQSITKSRDSTPRRTLAPATTAITNSRSPRKVPLPASPSLPSLSSHLKAGEGPAPVSRSPGLARSRSIASGSSSRVTAGSRNAPTAAEGTGTAASGSAYSRAFFEKMRGNKATSSSAATIDKAEKAPASRALPVPGIRRGITASATSTGISGMQAGSPRSKTALLASTSSPTKSGASTLASRPALSARPEATRDDVLARAAKRAEMRRAAEVGQAGPASRQSNIGPVRNNVTHPGSAVASGNLRRSIARPEPVSGTTSTIPPSTSSTRLAGLSTTSKRDEYRSVPRSRSSTRDLSKSTSSLASSTSSNKLAQAPSVPTSSRVTGLSRSTRVPTTTPSSSSIPARQSEGYLPPLPSASRPLARRSGLPVSQSSSSISSLSALATATAEPREAGAYGRNRESAIGGLGRVPKSYSTRGVSGLAG